MQSFSLILKNEKAKTYKLISRLIIIFNFIALLYLSITGIFKHPRYPFLIACLLMIAFVIEIVAKKRFNKTINIAIYFFIIIIGWLFLQLYLISVINIIFLIFHNLNNRRLIVSLNDKNIVYPSLPKRQIKWQELNNLVLKDGLLTIDFKNNKIIQAETEGNDAVDEKQFNNFCKTALSSAG
jgi:predicted PurR-regulated permease PerM